MKRTAPKLFENPGYFASKSQRFAAVMCVWLRAFVKCLQLFIRVITDVFMHMNQLAAGQCTVE
jgi:hypothetical protein